jgi:hypothetical protein
VAELAGLKGERTFSPTSVIELLTAIGISGLGPGPDYSDSPYDFLHSPVIPARESGDVIEKTMLQINRQVRTRNMSALKHDVSALWSLARKTQDHDEVRRRHYRRVIASGQLLRPDLELGGLAPTFYDAVLKLGFEFPLSYHGFCALEDCVAVVRPKALDMQRPLLEAVHRAGIGDSRVSAMVLGLLGGRELRAWFRSRELEAAELIAALSHPWERKHHATCVCDVTLLYLKEMEGQYDLRAMRTALHRHGYLAQALHLRYPDDPQYQLDTLDALLRRVRGTEPGATRGSRDPGRRGRDSYARLARGYVAAGGSSGPGRSRGCQRRVHRRGPFPYPLHRPGRDATSESYPDADQAGPAPGLTRPRGSAVIGLPARSRQI